jgi:hypothetical protein
LALAIPLLSNRETDLKPLTRTLATLLFGAP